MFTETIHQECLNFGTLQNGMLFFPDINSPLHMYILASIISKKVAESLDALVLDVKVGKGAFLKEEQDARELGKRMVNPYTNMAL